MAAKKAKIEQLREALRRRRAGSKAESVDEREALAWAYEAHRRLRRLIERTEKQDSGPGREDAVRQLDALRRASHWPPEDREAERERVSRDEAGRMKRIYSSVLPDVRRAKTFFSMYDSLTQADIDEHLADRPRLVQLAKALKLSWTVAVVAELCASKPSAWLIAKLADRTNYSDSAIKNFLHRRHRRSK